MKDLFRKFASSVSKLAGAPWTFVAAITLVVCWAITGPFFKYSTTWQLTINSFTTVITFLMVFLIQNTQNRDTKAVHLKLDELLKAIHGASNSMVDIEELSDEELEEIHLKFKAIREKSEKAIAYREKQKALNHESRK